jgi:hypothetical protein
MAVYKAFTWRFTRRLQINFACLSRRELYRCAGGYMAVTWRLHGGYMAVTWRLQT